ncbi:hypothetical protein P168DRAFT_127820 [Aspergillus campestris IBT 28561]|uniref:Uncharacterized protein n=1 Tax=Aspergillus campestris (strain IBT 28561) TaxID=1392248 RepID=A0A2I1D6Y1_ASPC2|nr:uncharacterized protein P168DRAFT_127820 [Aspergillus campestris IBT 28561]PKY05636.1 hypothetical protein P168DRAFT_127820 [Aspergillus campestris IBT 28561]
MACCGPRGGAWSWIDCPETKDYGRDVTWSDAYGNFFFFFSFPFCFIAWCATRVNPVCLQGLFSDDTPPMPR